MGRRRRSDEVARAEAYASDVRAQALAWNLLEDDAARWARQRERELRREAMRRAAVAGELAPGLG